MRLPSELATLAPEADLRTVVIRRQDRLAQTDDPKVAPAQAEPADGPFFAKGFATAQGFRPSYWRYGDAPDIEARGGCAMVDLRMAAAPRGLDRREPQEASREDDDFAALERAFLAAHLQALMQGPESETDCDGTMQPETPMLTPGNSDLCAPVADLRTVQLRRVAGDAALSDGVLMRKSIDAVQSSFVTAFTVAAPGGSDDTPGDASPLAGMQGEYRRPNDAEPPHDAVRDEAFMPASKGRAKPTLAPLQIAVIVFGCVALLASLGVFIPSDAPPPRDAVAVAVPLPQAVAPVAPPISPAVADFLARGDARLRSGDVTAARLFYEQAADAGNAHGALMVGATFDPSFLASIGVRGLRGDEKAASAWYRRAGELGDPEAAKLAKNPQRK